MVEKNATLRFFASLADVSSETVGSDSAIAVAARHAVEDPSPTAFVRAQEELAQLPDNLREDILKKLHEHMRSDLEAIWDNLPNAPKHTRPN